jgi:hypothetical protein
MEMGTTHHQTRWGGRNRRISGKMALSLVKWFLPTSCAHVEKNYCRGFYGWLRIFFESSVNTRVSTSLGKYL